MQTIIECKCGLMMMIKFNPSIPLEELANQVMPRVNLIIHLVCVVLQMAPFLWLSIPIIECKDLMPVVDSSRAIEFSIGRAILSSAKSQLLIQWSLFEWLLIELNWIRIGMIINEIIKSYQTIERIQITNHSFIQTLASIDVEWSLLLVAVIDLI